MKVLRVMNLENGKPSEGDVEFSFDDTEAMTKAKKDAQDIFDHITSKGSTVFAVNRGEGLPDKQVRSFNDLEESNLAVPRIVGG